MLGVLEYPPFSSSSAIHVRCTQPSSLKLTRRLIMCGRCATFCGHGLSIYRPLPALTSGPTGSGAGIGPTATGRSPRSLRATGPVSTLPHPAPLHQKTRATPRASARPRSHQGSPHKENCRELDRSQPLTHGFESRSKSFGKRGSLYFEGFWLVGWGGQDGDREQKRTNGPAPTTTFLFFSFFFPPTPQASFAIHSNENSSLYTIHKSRSLSIDRLGWRAHFVRRL